MWNSRPMMTQFILYGKGIWALSCIVYPVYNLVKRARKSASSFAASSFASNVCEWACGFIFGACAAMLCAACSSYLGEGSLPHGKTAKSFRKVLFWYGRIFAGFVLFGVAF